MRHCHSAGKIPVSIGIDTWGVDFALLDANNQPIGNFVAYRDARTTGMDEVVSQHISEKTLYARTGVQKLIFNTIYQLMAVKQTGKLDAAHRLMMLPDYLNYRLCGAVATEYTIATTTGLVNAHTRDWDEEIINACGYPRHIFTKIMPPGTVLGNLTDAIQAEVGFNCRVVLTASHDTASAVMAVPSLDTHTMWISSGTWSIMGVERLSADCSEAGRLKNIGYEGGYDYRYRYLKNIMGLWIIQSIRKELKNAYTYAELCEMALTAECTSIIDVNDERFLAPASMIKTIQDACEQTGQPVPKTPGELADVAYNSIAKCYHDTAQELEEMTGQHYDALYIVGGGSNATYLNELTARYTGKRVFAGPSEATAIGNLMAQMIAAGVFADLTAARGCVRQSFVVYS